MLVAVKFEKRDNRCIKTYEINCTDFVAINYISDLEANFNNYVEKINRHIFVKGVCYAPF